jgi:hypothetical protein
MEYRMSVLAGGGNPLGANRLFEYCVAFIPLEGLAITATSTPVPTLNELGFYGWELVGILPTATPQRPIGFFRRDLITTPGPGAPLALTAIEPASAVLGSPSFTMRILGTGFTPESILVWNESDDVCAFISETELNTTVNMQSAVAAVAVSVEVRNGEEISNSLSFTFLASA